MYKYKYIQNVQICTKRTNCKWMPKINPNWDSWRRFVCMFCQNKWRSIQKVFNVFRQCILLHVSAICQERCCVLAVKYTRNRTLLGSQPFIVNRGKAATEPIDCFKDIDGLNGRGYNNANTFPVNNHITFLLKWQSRHLHIRQMCCVEINNPSIYKHLYN